MKSKNLLPIEVENQKELFGGWSWDSGDQWREIQEVEIIGGSGGGWDNPFWGGYYPNDPDPDYYGGASGGSGGGGESNGGEHQLSDIEPPCPQLKATGECTIKALEVVSKYFKGDKMGIHKDDFAEHIGIKSIGDAFKSLIIGEGVKGSQLDKIVNDFFVNKQLDGSSQSIMQALDSGQPILSTIKMEGGIGHAVVITGYNSNTNEITIADSLADNGIRTMAYDPSNFYTQNAISGFQNNAIVEKYKNDTGDWWQGCDMKND